MEKERNREREKSERGKERNRERDEGKREKQLKPIETYRGCKMALLYFSAFSSIDHGKTL